jgi:hypothetical protein
MTDYVLKYQVWNGHEDGKLATFRHLEQAQLFADSVRAFYPKVFIYDVLDGQRLTMAD